MAADDELSAHRIVTHGGELEARQGAVAGYADVLNQSLVLAIEGVGRIDFGVYDQTLGSGVGLAARGLRGHELSTVQLDSVVFGIAYYHLISLADGYFNETGKGGQGGSTHRSRGEIAVEREGSERLSVDGGFTIR